VTTDVLYRDALDTVTGWLPTDGSGREYRQRFLDLLSDQPAAVRADNPGAHITASAMIISADLESVFLVLHRRIERWVQVGGHCEPGDASVAAAAMREAWEESGIEGLLLNPVPIDLDIHEVNCRHGASLHYDIRFGVLAPPGARATLSAESSDVGWFAAGALPKPLATATERLVAPAIRATRALATPARGSR
jgi:8-oxo-dGTP pyrophosphatase MutT (NUDIX family)